RRVVFADQIGGRRAIDRGARGEHEVGHATGSHRLQQGDHAGDVLGVRVQWAAHRDARVLEAGEMDHATDLVPGEDLIEESALQDAAVVKGDVPIDEAAVTT